MFSTLKFPLVLKYLSLSLLVSGSCFASDSQCVGTVNQGRISHSVKLPKIGSNFAVYSVVGSAIGRTYVHQQVADIMLAAYANLALAHPNWVYVYGETGWESGGRFRPHRSHQNGTSVDFFVPVIDAAGKSVPLPTGISTKFGYAIEFDSDAKYGEYHIDFEAMGEHLYQLDVAAKSRGLGIAMLIFEPRYLPKLYASKHGDYLRQHLTLIKGKPWVRHDEHYHVDFAIPCQANPA